MSSHAQQARTLVEALPYIQKFTGKTIVVKYGGNAMVSDELRRAVMCDIILLSLVGIRVFQSLYGGARRFTFEYPFSFRISDRKSVV